MTNADAIYQDLLIEILDCGDEIETRNHKAISNITLPNVTFDRTPLVTFRKTAWRKALREMEWFMSGSMLCPEELKDWWNGQLDDDGCLMDGYSAQFRRSSFMDHCGDLDNFDQVEFVKDKLKKHPNSRRLVVTTWNPGEMANITIANDNPNTPTCCHGTVLQFFVRDGKMHIKHYQRSADMLLGVPHNWIQYWALLLYFAHHAGLKPGSLTWIWGDAHIYSEESHDQAAYAIRESEPRECPNLVYTPTSDDFLASDFSLDCEVPEPLVTIRPKLL